MPDYPDGWMRSSPGHATEFDTAASLPWSVETSLAPGVGALATYQLNFNDDEYVYLIDNIYLGWTSLSFGYAYVYFSGLPVAVQAIYPTAIIPMGDNPSIQFIDGDYLKITARHGESSTRTLVIVIAGTKFPKPYGFGHPPSANFTVDDHTIAHGGHVTFTDTSLFSPTSWLWDFGDGSDLSTEQNPTHTYAVAGSYYPKLKATNIYGHDFYVESSAIVVS